MYLKEDFKRSAITKDRQLYNKSNEIDGQAWELVVVVK